MSAANGNSLHSLVVLFVRDQSHYKVMGLDCYDRRRDARTFAGTGPVIAHPPCRTWGNLRTVATRGPLSRSGGAVGCLSIPPAARCLNTAAAVPPATAVLS